MLRPCAGKPEMERQEPCFLVRCKKKKKRCTKKTVSVPLSSPGRQDAAPRRCTFASGPPPPLPPVPTAPVPPLGIRALLARLLSRTPRARVRGWGRPGTRTAAVQQELHSERQPAPAAVHRENPLAGPPDPCARPLARPFLPHRPRAPQRPPQRAAPCTAHRSYKTSRDTHRTCAAAPTRPQRTRCSREGIDAQAAHWQVSGGALAV